MTAAYSPEAFDLYRTTQLAEARREEAKARAAWHLAVSKGQKAKALKASEDIEFWSNKTAFLANVRA